MSNVSPNSNLRDNSNENQCENENEFCDKCEKSFVAISKNTTNLRLITSTPNNQSLCPQKPQSCQQLNHHLSNNNRNESYPFDESIVYDISMANRLTDDSYEQSLSQLTGNQFLSLRQLESINTTNEQLSERVVNVYGIADSIININELTKKVLVIDPTKSDGIYIILNNTMTDIATKNILRLTNISIVTSSNGKIFTVNESKNLAQFNAFTYDYESDNHLDYELVFGKNNLNLESDKPVSKLLEEWFAQRFLDNNRLNKLPAPSDNVTYVDFACLVIGSQLMKQTIQLTIYDGSQPNFVVENQFRSDYAEDGASNSYYRFNEDEVYQNNFNRNHFGFVNVWRNRSNQHNDHFEKAEGTTLRNGDDLLILFNVEMTKGSQNGSVRLNLRSGRHHGKGIRKVNRLSILGRKLILRIRAHKSKPVPQNIDATQQLDISHLSDFSFNESTNAPTINHPIVPLTIEQEVCQKSPNESEMTELLKLGSRKLQALYDQQIREKDYPLIYRNGYKYDLNLIKDVLKRSRQWSRFPITSYTNSVPQLIEIENLNKTEDDIDKLFLVRAKVIDLFPESVFPRNKFVFLKCNFCDFTETFKNHSNSVNANIPFNSSQLLQCPQCSDRINASLIYFYAIIFVIQDSNTITKVCLAKRNAVNVFGIEANQVLDDSDSALRLDNILFEIVKMSTQDNGVDWIIKKKINNDNQIHEVITVAPLGTFHTS